MRRTKSRDLSFYQHFFKFDDPADIDTVKLAKELNVSQQKVAGHLRSAKNNSTITQALIKQGDTPPPWFASAETLLRRSSTAQVPVNTAQPAETHASLTSIETASTYDRSAALRVRSAPPANVYRLVQPVYQPPRNPLIEEMLREIRDLQNEKMRESLDQMKRRRDPPKPMSLDAILAIAEVSKIIQQNEDRKKAQMISTIIAMNAVKASEQINTEEIKDQFTKPFKEMRMVNERRTKENRETLAAVGEIYKNCIPKIGPPDDLIQLYKATNQEKRKSEKEAIISVAKMISEKRNNKKYYIQMMEYQGRVIMDNFWKNLNRMRS